MNRLARSARTLAHGMSHRWDLLRRSVVGHVGGSTLLTAAWYTLTPGVFGREKRAVAAGIRNFRRDTVGVLFTLRRNTHMLEKGLVMRPRRAVFALEYIGATVDALGRLAQDDSVSEGELAWPRAVLQTYFEVVGEDDSGTIRNAKERFEAVCSSGTFAPHPGAVSSVPYSQGTLDRSPVTPEAFVGLAQQRRSVRWFDGAPVPREVIDRAIEVGALAPSACNRQPFRFIVTTDAATVAQLIDLPLGTRGYGHQVPGLIVAVGNLSAFYSERDRHLIYIDASMAIMQMALAFETEGVSTCCINWPDIAERERLARRVLELERWEQIVMFVAFGYADPTGGVPYSAKRPLDELRSYLGHSHVEEVPSHGRH